MKTFIILTTLIILSQIDQRQKLYSEGLVELDKMHFKNANFKFQKAFSIKPDSRIAYWIAYSFAQEDSIQSCLLYLSKSLTLNPEVLDSPRLSNITLLENWAKERDYNTYVKFSLSLSYKFTTNNFVLSHPEAGANPYFLKRVQFNKDTIAVPFFCIDKKKRKEILNENN
jgi:hypothetical protein